MKNLTAFLVALALAACSTSTPPRTTKGYERVLDTWYGASELELVSSWGEPRSVYEVDSSSRLLTFLNWGCETRFTIKDGTVVNWSFRGTECKAEESE